MYILDVGDVLTSLGVSLRLPWWEMFRIRPDISYVYVCNTHLSFSVLHLVPRLPTLLKRDKFFRYNPAGHGLAIGVP